ncbi:MAG: hypothetical protein NT079_02505, partial [Candidatus Omnitrophica bacterium]|nr:hypothetical protein [Candidatus Omnitrophota bacterium]
MIQYVYAAVIFAGMMYLTNSMNDVVDARGLTIAFERSRIFQKIGAVLFILFVFQQHALNMKMLFCFNYIFFLVAIFFSFYIVRRGGLPIHFERLKFPETRSYIKEFYKYSKPLVVLGLIGLGVGLFDRWFLQVMGGGIEQGFYSLSFKVGALCFMFSGAMTQLITREFSIAYEKKDLEEMARLFRRHIPLLYGITAVIACFVLVNADKVAVIMGGKEFHSAVIPVAIMA